MSFFQGIKLVMGHGPYAKLVMVFLFTSLGFMVSLVMKVKHDKSDVLYINAIENIHIQGKGGGWFY